MSLFSAPKVVLLPKKDSLEIYLGKKDNNAFTFNIDLFKDLPDSEIQPLLDFFKSNSKEVYCCLPDDVSVTKSFIYDSKAENLDKKEIKALAESSITFPIEPEFIDFQLDQNLPDKTIIRAKISDASKLTILQKNLAKLGLTVRQYETVSQLIANVVVSFYKDDYFFVYPTSGELFLILAKGQSVFLTTKLKGASPELQKIINYSPLYFQKNTTKIFVPQDIPFEVKSTTPMEASSYQSIQIISSLNLPPSLPLPVAGFLLPYVVPATSVPITTPVNSDIIINKSPMETKKNVLPIIIVFIVTAAIASAILWFVTKRSASNTPIETPISDVTPTAEVAQTTLPTSAPVPTATAVSKKIKIEVLNATDINGQAAKVKAELATLGFTSVTVGNSSEKATENEIRLKAASSSSSAYFKQNLKSFEDAKITTLKTGTYDVVIVIGSDLGSGSTSTANPTPEP